MKRNVLRLTALPALVLAASLLLASCGQNKAVLPVPAAPTASQGAGPAVSADEAQAIDREVQQTLQDMDQDLQAVGTDSDVDPDAAVNAF